MVTSVVEGSPSETQAYFPFRHHSRDQILGIPHADDSGSPAAGLRHASGSELRHPNGGELRHASGSAEQAWRGSPGAAASSLQQQRQGLPDGRNSPAQLSEAASRPTDADVLSALRACHKSLKIPDSSTNKFSNCACAL